MTSWGNLLKHRINSYITCIQATQSALLWIDSKAIPACFTLTNEKQLWSHLNRSLPEGKLVDCNGRIAS